jgi:hypothetical protein
MLAMKKMVLGSMATAVLVTMPAQPAAAAGPLFIAPWALGHIVLPLIAAATAASQPAPYGPGPANYSGAAGIYPSGSYYGRPPVYYGPPLRYPSYYRPARQNLSGTVPFYSPPRSYYQSRPTYYGVHGGQGYSRGGSYSYRRR